MAASSLRMFAEKEFSAVTCGWFVGGLGDLVMLSEREGFEGVLSRDTLSSLSGHVTLARPVYKNSFFSGTTPSNASPSLGMWIPRSICVTVTASRCAIGRETKNTDFCSDDQPNSWIRYDFKGLRVAPTSYSITISDPHGFPRLWVLEVS